MQHCNVLLDVVVGLKIGRADDDLVRTVPEQVCGNARHLFRPRCAPQQRLAVRPDLQKPAKVLSAGLYCAWPGRNYDIARARSCTKRLPNGSSTFDSSASSQTRLSIFLQSLEAGWAKLVLAMLLRQACLTSHLRSDPANLWLKSHVQHPACSFSSEEAISPNGILITHSHGGGACSEGACVVLPIFDNAAPMCIGHRSYMPIPAEHKNTSLCMEEVHSGWVRTEPAIGCHACVNLENHGSTS
jgi:hypothetical protein